MKIKFNREGFLNFQKNYYMKTIKSMYSVFSTVCNINDQKLF